MAEILEAINQFTQEERYLFKQKMAQALKEAKAKLEEAFKQEEEDSKRGYILFKGKKLQKNYRQFIPCTEEEWKEKTEKQKRYKEDTKRLKETNNFLRVHLSELFGE